jgi:hypothetical protein
MENLDTNKSLFDFNFDEQVKEQLKGTATWAGIAAIISLSGYILGVINYFFMRGKVQTFRSTAFPDAQLSKTETAGGFIGIFITLLIGIFLFYYLNTFSKSAKAGVDSNNQPLINKGLGNLSSYFKLIGVLLIICIVLFGLALLIGIGSKL